MAFLSPTGVDKAYDSGFGCGGGPLSETVEFSWKAGNCVWGAVRVVRDGGGALLFMPHEKKRYWGHSPPGLNVCQECFSSVKTLVRVTPFCIPNGQFNYKPGTLIFQPRG